MVVNVQRGAHIWEDQAELIYRKARESEQNEKSVSVFILQKIEKAAEKNIRQKENGDCVEVLVKAEQKGNYRCEIDFLGKIHHHKHYIRRH